MPIASIQKALPEESEVIRGCFSKAFAQARARISDFPDVTDGIEESIRDGLVIVARLDEDICGALTFHFTDLFLKIEVVAVTGAARGKGVGRALMQAAEEEAKKRGISELRLRTHIEVPENVELYRHLGWKISSQDNVGVNMARKI